MWNKLTGKDSDVASSSSKRKSTSDRSDRDKRERRTESLVSSGSTRAPAGSSRGDKEERRVSRSSTFPLEEHKSGASSYATAPSERYADLDATSRRTSRKHRDKDKDEDKTQYRVTERGLERIRNSSTSPDRSKSGSKRGNREEPREERRKERQRGPSGTSVVGAHERSRSEQESTRGPADFPSQIVGSGFSQFPGQDGAPMAGFAGPSQSAHSTSDAHIANQFPGQQPAYQWHDGKPVSEGGVGLAAEYYGDQGQSVESQPGFRPHTPNMLVNPDAHLTAASAVANPAQDTGHGSAADFYSGKVSPVAFAANGSSSTSKPLKKPSKQSSGSSSGFAGAAALAGTAAAGYALSQSNGHKPSKTSGSSTSIYQQGSNVSVMSSHDDLYSQPPPSNGRPGKQSSHSNAAAYAAGAAALGAAGAYALHEHHEHEHHEQHNGRPSNSHGRPPRPMYNMSDGSFVMNQYGAPNGMMIEHKHRGPVSRLVDWWKDYEDVRKMEAYTQELGVCRYCFDPQSSVYDAPRKHHYNRRKRSKESLNGRVGKQSRYGYASDEDKGWGVGKWIGAGLAGYGVAKVGKKLVGDNRDFDDTYSVKSGRRISDMNGSRISLVSHGNRRGSDSDGRRRSYSRQSEGIVRTNSGRHGSASIKADVKGDGSREYATVRTKTKHRSRSRSSSSRERRSSKSGLVGAGVGLAAGAVAAHELGKHSRHSRSKSPAVRVRHSHRSRSRSSDRSVRRRSSHSKKKAGFFTWGNASSSSTDSALVYGFNVPRRKSSVKSFKSTHGSTVRDGKKKLKHKSSEEKLTATLAGLAATGAALSAVQAGRSKRRHNADLVAVKERKGKKRADATLLGVPSPHGRRKHERSRSGASNGSSSSSSLSIASWRDETAVDDDGWEDESTIGAADLPSPVSSDDGLAGLAYGDYSWGSKKARKSTDSLVSNASGTDKWGWRWGNKKTSKRRSSDIEAHSGGGIGTAATIAGAAVAGAAAASMIDKRKDDRKSVQFEQRPAPTPLTRKQGAPSEASSVSGSMHTVYPVPTSDPYSFDAVGKTGRTPSRSNTFPLQQSDTVVYASRPEIKQPQPISKVKDSVYTTQADYQPSSTVTAGLPSFSQYDLKQPLHPPRRESNDISPGENNYKRDLAIGAAAAVATGGVIAALSKDEKDKDEKRRRRKEDDEYAERVRRKGEEDAREMQRRQQREAEDLARLKREADDRESEKRRAADSARDNEIRQQQYDKEMAARAQIAMRDQQAKDDFQAEVDARYESERAERKRQRAERERERERADAERVACETASTDRERQRHASDAARVEAAREVRHTEHADDSNKWVTPLVAAAGAAVAGAVVADMTSKHEERKRDHDEADRNVATVVPIIAPEQVITVTPNKVAIDMDADNNLEDALADPDFFTKMAAKQQNVADHVSRSNTVEYTPIKRPRSRTEVMRDFDDRYKDVKQEVNNEDFWAPEELRHRVGDGAAVEESEKKRDNPNADVVFDDYPGAKHPPYEPSYAFSVGKSPGGFGPPIPYDLVPRLNLVPPTPPPILPEEPQKREVIPEAPNPAERQVQDEPPKPEPTREFEIVAQDEPPPTHQRRGSAQSHSIGAVQIVQPESDTEEPRESGDKPRKPLSSRVSFGGSEMHTYDVPSPEPSILEGHEGHFPELDLNEQAAGGASKDVKDIETPVEEEFMSEGVAHLAEDALNNPYFPREPEDYDEGETPRESETPIYDATSPERTPVYEPPKERGSFYEQPFHDTVSDAVLGADGPSPRRPGYVLGEVETPGEERKDPVDTEKPAVQEREEPRYMPSMPGTFDDEAAPSASTEPERARETYDEPDTPQADEVDEFVGLNKKQRKKAEKKKAERLAAEAAAAGAIGVAGVAAAASLTRDEPEPGPEPAAEDEWNDIPKKSKKKSKSKSRTNGDAIADEPVSYADEDDVDLPRGRYDYEGLERKEKPEKQQVEDNDDDFDEQNSRADRRKSPGERSPPRSVVSEGHEDRRKSKRKSHKADADDYIDEAYSKQVSASEPGGYRNGDDIDEGKRKRKSKSRRSGDDFEDAVSVVSSRSTYDDDEKSRKKDKRGSLASLASSIIGGSTGSSKRENDRDVEERSEVSSRSRSSKYDDEEDDDERRKRKKEKRRSKSERDEDESFLGDRAEESKMAPLPPTVAAAGPAPDSTPSTEQVLDARQERDILLSDEGGIVGRDTRTIGESLGENDQRVHVPKQSPSPTPEQKAFEAGVLAGIQNTLVRQRGDSTTSTRSVTKPTPPRPTPINTSRTYSPTSVPVRFRRPPVAGHGRSSSVDVDERSRPQSADPFGTASSSPLADTARSTPRHFKSSSVESPVSASFRANTQEMRPLYLVERNRYRNSWSGPDSAATGGVNELETLPSLPSSRASSVLGSEEDVKREITTPGWEDAVEAETTDDFFSAHGTPERTREDFFSAHGTPDREEDYLDSQEATPRASHFDPNVFDRYKPAIASDVRADLFDEREPKDTRGADFERAISPKLGHESFEDHGEAHTGDRDDAPDDRLERREQIVAQLAAAAMQAPGDQSMDVDMQEQPKHGLQGTALVSRDIFPQEEASPSHRPTSPPQSVQEDLHRPSLEDSNSIAQQETRTEVDSQLPAQLSLPDSRPGSPYDDIVESHDRKFAITTSHRQLDEDATRDEPSGQVASMTNATDTQLTETKTEVTAEDEFPDLLLRRGSKKEKKKGKGKRKSGVSTPVTEDSMTSDATVAEVVQEDSTDKEMSRSLDLAPDSAREEESFPETAPASAVSPLLTRVASKASKKEKRKQKKGKTAKQAESWPEEPTVEEPAAIEPIIELTAPSPEGKPEQGNDKSVSRDVQADELDAPLSTQDSSADPTPFDSVDEGFKAPTRKEKRKNKKAKRNQQYWEAEAEPDREVDEREAQPSLKVIDDDATRSATPLESEPTGIENFSRQANLAAPSETGRAPSDVATPSMEIDDPFLTTPILERPELDFSKRPVIAHALTAPEMSTLPVEDEKDSEMRDIDESGGYGGEWTEQLEESTFEDGQQKGFIMEEPETWAEPLEESVIEDGQQKGFILPESVPLPEDEMDLEELEQQISQLDYQLHPNELHDAGSPVSVRIPEQEVVNDFEAESEFYPAAVVPHSMARTSRSRSQSPRHRTRLEESVPATTSENLEDREQPLVEPVETPPHRTPTPTRDSLKEMLRTISSEQKPEDDTLSELRQRMQAEHTPASNSEETQETIVKPSSETVPREETHEREELEYAAPTDIERNDLDSPYLSATEEFDGRTLPTREATAPIGASLQELEPNEVLNVHERPEETSAPQDDTPAVYEDSESQTCGEILEDNVEPSQTVPTSSLVDQENLETSTLDNDQREIDADSQQAEEAAWEPSAKKKKNKKGKSASLAAAATVAAGAATAAALSERGDGDDGRIVSESIPRDLVDETLQKSEPEQIAASEPVLEPTAEEEWAPATSSKKKKDKKAKKGKKSQSTSRSQSIARPESTHDVPALPTTEAEPEPREDRVLDAADKTETIRDDLPAREGGLGEPDQPEALEVEAGTLQLHNEAAPGSVPLPGTNDEPSEIPEFEEATPTGQIVEQAVEAADTAPFDKPMEVDQDDFQMPLKQSKKEKRKAKKNLKALEMVEPPTEGLSDHVAFGESVSNPILKQVTEGPPSPAVETPEAAQAQDETVDTGTPAEEDWSVPAKMTKKQKRKNKKKAEAFEWDQPAEERTEEDAPVPYSDSEKRRRDDTSALEQTTASTGAAFEGELPTSASDIETAMDDRAEASKSPEQTNMVSTFGSDKGLSDDAPAPPSNIDRGLDSPVSERLVANTASDEQPQESVSLVNAKPVAAGQHSDSETRNFIYGSTGGPDEVASTFSSIYQHDSASPDQTRSFIYGPVDDATQPEAAHPETPMELNDPFLDPDHHHHESGSEKISPRTTAELESEQPARDDVMGLPPSEDAMEVERPLDDEKSSNIPAIAAGAGLAALGAVALRHAADTHDEITDASRLSASEAVADMRPVHSDTILDRDAIDDSLQNDGDNHSTMREEPTPASNLQQVEEEGHSPTTAELQDVSHEPEAEIHAKGQVLIGADRDIDAKDDKNTGQNKVPPSDVEFAAALAAGLEESGMNPNLVLDNATYYTKPTSSDRAVVEEEYSPPPRNRKKGRASRTPSNQSLRQDANELVPETSSGMPAEPETSFDDTLAAGLSNAGFDADTIMKEAASSGRDSPVDAEPEAFFVTSKKKKKKGKKGRAVESETSNKENEYGFEREAIKAPGTSSKLEEDIAVEILEAPDATTETATLADMPAVQDDDEWALPSKSKKKKKGKEGHISVPKTPAPEPEITMLIPENEMKENLELSQQIENAPGTAREILDAGVPNPDDEWTLPAKSKKDKKNKKKAARLDNAEDLSFVPGTENLETPRDVMEEVEATQESDAGRNSEETKALEEQEVDAVVEPEADSSWTTSSKKKDTKGKKGKKGNAAAATSRAPVGALMASMIVQAEEQGSDFVEVPRKAKGKGKKKKKGSSANTEDEATGTGATTPAALEDSTVLGMTEHGATPASLEDAVVQEMPDHGAEPATALEPEVAAKTIQRAWRGRQSKISAPIARSFPVEIPASPVDQAVAGLSPDQAARKIQSAWRARSLRLQPAVPYADDDAVGLGAPEEVLSRDDAEEPEEMNHQVSLTEEEAARRIQKAWRKRPQHVSQDNDRPTPQHRESTYTEFEEDMENDDHGATASAILAGGMAAAGAAAAGYMLQDETRRETQSPEPLSKPKSAQDINAAYESAWSFPANCDSAIQVSPVIGEQARHASVRDSGFHEGSSSPVARRASGEEARDNEGRESPFLTGTTTSSADPLRVSVEVGSDWDLTMSNPSMQASTTNQARSIEASRELPDIEEAASPRSDSNKDLGIVSPMQSATKPRASELFNSSSSARDFATPDVSSYDTHERGRGGLGSSEDADAARQAYGRSPSGTLDTIAEHNPEDSPLLKKSRHLSDVGMPEHGVKALRRTETPDAVRRVHRGSGSRSPLPRLTTGSPAEGQRSLEHPRQPVPMDELISGKRTHDFADLQRGLRRSSDQRSVSGSQSPAHSTTPRHGVERVMSPPDRVRSPGGRSPSVLSDRSNGSLSRFRTPEHGYHRTMSSSSQGSTHSLRRVDRSASGDLRERSRAESSSAKSPLGPTSPSREEQQLQSHPGFEPQPGARALSKGKGRASDMGDTFEAMGAARGSPMSPTRPPSVRKRQSMAMMELESKVEQFTSENRQLQDRLARAEHEAQLASQQLEVHAASIRTATDDVRARDMHLSEKDAELAEARSTLQTLQEELARLRHENEELQGSHRGLSEDAEGKYAALQSEHAKTYQSWQESSRELDDLRNKHQELSGSMEELVHQEIALALADRNEEIKRLNEELESALGQIKILQHQILESKQGESFLTVRDEDYFDSACQQLCQHVSQWVLKFSKFSDNRQCRLSSELDKIRDLKPSEREKLEDRLDSAVLDGSDADLLLVDRIQRRDVFMSLVMSMLWEHVFTRYLFGMDREQRQKLKQLEKTLSEIGPKRAVAQWRAITLSLLAKRPSFQSQRTEDTEAVMWAIYTTLSTLLPPPKALEAQVQDQLRKVIRLAVDLSIEMRTQRAEYIMLQPLQPEYDTNGDLVQKVPFNAALMNERSGDKEVSSNEEWEQRGAMVKIMLFPLVVKKGDDLGEGDDEVVICPAQVMVAKSKKGKNVRVLSGAVDMDPRKSMQSVMPPESEMGGT